MSTLQRSASISSSSTIVSTQPSSVPTGVSSVSTIPSTTHMLETPQTSLIAHEKPPPELDETKTELVQTSLVSANKTQSPTLDGLKTVQWPTTSLSEALKALLNQNIPVMEYGSQILYRWGCEELLFVAEWAVPGALLKLASRVLTESGFPWAPAPMDDHPTLSGWEDLCEHHIRVTSGEHYIRLYDISTLGLTLNKTFEVRSTFDPNLRLLTPQPPRDSFSVALPANTQYYGEEDYAEVEREFLEKVPSAVEYIKSWDWGDVPDKEYWDIAEAVVRDARVLYTVTRVAG
ncbi:hypothetical protein BDV26DRAFT_287652 [Aspergillus bertholletiae]|uniref:Uncharacterized protein n=1 Tax=Aspergillus bertholletiae TaxID=1226010 RepID=A0A5N7BNR8_9EURO|nr:hypothetical protein BDV26DRAFT_287652 [Aspergillus bertholletiae]